MATAARATDIHWNAADADWNTATNWNPNTVPTSPDRAVLDAAPGSIANVTTAVPSPAGVSVTNGNRLDVEAGGVLNNADTDGDANGVRIGDAGAGSANVSGGGQLLTTGGGGDANVWVGIAGGNGTLTQTGAGSKTEGSDVKIGEQLNSVGVVNFQDGTMDSRAWTLIGNDSGDGTLNVGTVAGGNPVYTSQGSDFLVGNGAGSKGTVNQAGGTVTGGWTQIGKAGGSGTYNLSGGTFRTRNDNLIGNEPGSTGTVHQTGGTWSVAGVMFVGNTGNATYTLDAGDVVTGSDIFVGVNGPSNSTFVQNGGSVHMQNGWAFVGRNGATGNYKMAAGEAKFAGQLNVGYINSGSGTVTQTGGIVRAGMKADPNENHLMSIGRDNGQGTYNISGGELIVGLNDGVFVPPDNTTNPPTRLDPDGVDNDLVIGADLGSTGTLNVTGGTVSVARWIIAGRARQDSPGGTGVVNHSAGTVASKGWLRLGEVNGSSGTYNLSGTGVLNVGGGDPDTGDDDVIIGVDFGAQGTMAISGGTLNAARDIAMGMNGGHGTYTQTGGDANVNAAVFVGHSGTSGGALGTGTFSVTGGTLDVGLDLVAGLAAPVQVGDPPVEVATNADGAISIGGTANVTVGGNTVIGEAAFAGSTATGTLTQSGGTLTTAGLIVSANPGQSTGTYNLSGGQVSSLSTTNNGTIAVSGNAQASLGPVGGSGSMTIAGTAMVDANHVRQPSVAMTGGTVRIADTGRGTADGVSRIGSYTLDGDARFDLRDNKLVTDKPAGTYDGTAYTGVHGDVARAYNFGAWDQPGLTTSEPNAGQNAGPLSGTTTIAVATAEQVLFIGPADTAVFMGQTVTGATTIAMYTYAGDVNLDGLVDGADYGTLDNWFQFPGTSGYANGDVNYDGVIDGADYGVLDNTIQLQGEPFLGVLDSASGSAAAGIAGVTAVPEPSACGLAVLGAAALLGRRRRRAK